MQVRRTAAVTGVLTALVLLGGPAWADETPFPGPGCSFVPTPTDTPTDVVTDGPTVEPTDEVTAEPTDTPTDTPTDEVTDEPTVEPTDVVTDDPTVDPTVDPEPTDTPTDDPGGYYVCESAAQAGSGDGGPTLGSGTLELPFSGAPVGLYAVTGFALVLAGAGTVAVARRRTG